MMAELEENFQYGLSSSRNSASNKTILLLKLTDTSLKTIELYQNIKSSTKHRPSIQFKGSKGTITFPVESNDGESQSREFKFTSQSLSTPSASSFECIQQYGHNYHDGSPLEAVGGITGKVVVTATDEVYQDTRDKMKLADEEMKKTSTKEVSQKGLKPGRKVKLKGTSNLAKEIIAKKKSDKTPVSSSSSISSLSSSAMSSSSSSGKSAITWNNGAKNSSTSSKTNSGSSGGGSKPTQPSRPSVPHKSYRERIIHLLALRPYKKPELIVRLRDGVNQKDKKQLAAILTQVASLSKDMSYVLNKHLYSEVQEDWPLYSDEDRHKVRKHLDNFHKSPAHSVSPSASPPPVIPNKPKPPERLKNIKKSIQKASKSSTSKTSSQKRQLLPEYIDYKPAKKARVAHYKKPGEAPNGTSNSTNSSPSTKSDIVSTTNPSPVMNPSPDQSSSSANHASISPSRKSKEHRSSKSKHGIEEVNSSGSSKKGVDSTGKHSPVSTGKHSPAGVVSSTSNVPEYISIFTTISSMEQRARYKDDFNVEYPIYKQLHQEVADVTKRFANMKKKLNEVPKDSEEFRKISDRVIEEYSKIQEDQSYQDKRNKWQELHDKLEHIKALITAYDATRYDTAR